MLGCKQVLLVKRFGNVEHIIHVYEFVNIPLGQVPVETTDLTKDTAHIGDLCHVPFPDRPVWRTRGAIAHRLQFA